MATWRCAGWVLACSMWMTALANAQDATATQVPPPPPPHAAEVPPPPPADAPAATSIPEPPTAYAGQAEASASISTSDNAPVSNAPASNALPAAPPVIRDPNARRLFSVWLGLGYGDAIGCGNEDPTDPCAVEGALTLALGADYRFVPNFSVGLEIGLWGFAVSDAWRGSLTGEPDEVQIGAGYLSLIGRWYWFDKGVIDPFLQLGLGFGSMTADARNDEQRFVYEVTGVVTHLVVGAEFQVHPAIRFGPQLGAALLLGNEICTRNDGRKECREPATDDDGDQEGNLLAWRFMLVGSILFGAR